MQEPITEVAAFRSLVLDAISAGMRQRTEREQSEADRAQRELQRIIDAAPERAHTTLQAIPEIVRKAAASSSRNSVCVMWLERHEYSGVFSVWPNSRYYDEPQRSPAFLQHAGQRVFEALTQANLNPEIKYGYKPETRRDSSPLLQQIGIYISLS